MMKESTLLLVDGVINLVLGILLLFFPKGIVTALALPDTDSLFYPTILGAVLTGIGVALLLERFRPRRLTGLGLGGAISINLCGAAALLVWLVNGRLDIALRGHVVLWAIVIVLLGISLVEVLSYLDRKDSGRQ